MKKTLINRPAYLEFLFRHKDKPIIKVLSGVRRVGKSMIFELYKKALLQAGVKKQQIITINFEDLRYYSLRDFLKLNEYITSKLVKGEQNYIFLDEVQHVNKFELTVDSLFIQKNTDLYLTGSNAYFMSGELATNLTGRYVEKEVLPISFKEYYEFTKNNKEMTLQKAFQIYFPTAFPYPLLLNSKTERNEYLAGIYDSILAKDIVWRTKVSDVAILERILRTLLSTIGSLVSINKIKNTLASDGFSMSNHTLEKYLNGILDSLIMYSVPRFNIKGRDLLRRFEKYYAVDLGIRNLLLPDHQEDLGHLLENIVFLELKRRYKKVYVGQIDNLEVDFVTLNEQNETTYFQVALNTLNQETLNRELHSLAVINDSYPKFLLTMDEIITTANYNGIQKLNIIDWLLK